VSIHPPGEHFDEDGVTKKGTHFEDGGVTKYLMDTLDKLSLFFLAFWDFNEEFKGFTSVRGSINHIVAITGISAVAGTFGGIAGRRMCEA
jgi:hypothetical protein